jgi:hypothetical protein
MRSLFPFDSLDYRIIRELGRNSRASASEIASAFPAREILSGGGNIHCIT